MDDGTEIKGLLKDFDYQKGIVKKVKIEDLSGKKVKLKPEQIKFMYLPQSLRDKISKVDSYLTDATKWKSQDLNQDIIADGYVYFEKSKVKIGKKEKELIFQLLNVSFSDKVKIYNNPFAKETASIGVGGIKVAGGDAKSYYFKKGDEPAYLLKKKNYKDEFKLIWSDCPKIIETYSENIKWSEFPQHAFDYTNDCK